MIPTRLQNYNKLYVRQLRIAIFDAFFIYSRLLKLFRHLFAILRDGVQLAALTKHFQSASLRFGYIILIARDDPRKLSLFFRRRADPFYRRQNRARLVVPKTAAVRRQVVRSDQYAVYAFNLQYLLDIRTLYNYIEKGVFLRLDLKHLPLKGKRKKHNRKVKIAAKPSRGTSIEKRPAVINDRTEFGHWEMDCVEGKKKKKETILALSERLTRREIVIKIPDKTTTSVVKALNSLERRYGKHFRKIFKSITVDNGTEFSDRKGMEKSIYNGQRTEIYYCHPYSSYERGTNERLNREIRRKIPKGSDLTKYSAQDIQDVENWLNDYPRQILDFATPNELFNACLSSI